MNPPPIFIDKDERALVLSSLLPHLRVREELIKKIFGFAYFLKYRDIKFQILSSFFLISTYQGMKNLLKALNW